MALMSLEAKDDYENGKKIYEFINLLIKRLDLFFDLKDF